MSDPDLIIIKQWKKFVEINPTHSNFSTVGDGLGKLKTLKDHNAVYHKGCCAKVNDSHYNGLVKKEEKERRENESLANAKILHKREKTELGMAVYLFYGEEDSKDQLCSAGELHSGSCNLSMKHVKLLMNKWKSMALQLDKLDIHAKLCTGYVRVSQMFYHKSHLTQFRNIYRSLQLNKEGPEVRRSNFLLQCYTWKEISNHIYDSTEQFIKGVL